MGCRVFGHLHPCDAYGRGTHDKPRKEMSSVATEEMSSVAAEEMSSAATEDMSSGEMSNKLGCPEA